nr:TetR/AcrR family transcriptional regulator [Hyphomonas sp. Mor2]
MARPKATPEQRAEVRRSIQRAAAELYREEGLGGVSARSVAKKAGVSVGTIYSYFGDLAGLGQSLWEGRIAKQDEVFREIAAQHDDPLTQIEALLDAYLTFGIEQHELYRSVLLFVRPEGMGEPEQQPVSAFAFPTLLKAAIEAGQAAGQIRGGDPGDLAQLLWSGVHGAIALPINLARLELKAVAEVKAVTVAGLMRMARI